MADNEDKPVGADCVSALASELRAARVQAGRSLKELERLTASSDSSLSRYLAGTSIPPWPVVDALCKAAQRDPGELEPLWQEAQRTRVERRVSSRTMRETLSAEPDRTRTDGAPPDSPAPLDEESDAGTRPGTGARTRRRRKVLLAGSGAGAVALAATLVMVVPGSSRHAAPVFPSPSGARICPWHYVVTDGDPAPVLISDGNGPNRKHIGIYEPGQVFYAPEPPVKSNGLMKTLDGWVTAGNWIQRYGGPCIKRADLITGPTPTPGTSR